MEQTTEKRYFITKSTAFYDKTTREGNLLLSAITNKEKFFDFLEDIYAEAEPGQVETIGEYDNHLKASHAYQACKDLFVKVLPEKEQIVLIWTELKDEDGELYGKSFYKNAHLEHVLDVVKDFSEAPEETQEQIIDYLESI